MDEAINNPMTVTDKVNTVSKLFFNINKGVALNNVFIITY